MADTFTGDVEGAWNQLKTDFEASEPDMNFGKEGFWDQTKSQFHRGIAAGKLPVDAFNLAMSPVMGAIHAGPVKALAAAENAGFKALPGFPKDKVPSQEATEGQLMGDLAAVGPEKGVALTPAAIPKVSDLKAASKAAYKVVDQSGMRIAPKAVSDLHNTLSADLKTQGFDHSLMPRTHTAVNRVKEAADGGQPHSLQEVEILRRIAGHAAKSMEPADRYMARIVQDHIDDFVDNLGPQHLIGTKDPAAIKALGDAREAWKRMSKGEIIESAIEKANTNAQMFSASGKENALRRQFNKIANNDRAMRRFSKEEQTAIKKVAMGGPIANGLRMLGKFAPHGIVSAGVSAGLGAAAGGLHGAIALPVAGEIGRAGATAMTARNARMASELVRNGRAPAALRPAAAGKYLYPPTLDQNDDRQ